MEKLYELTDIVRHLNRSWKELGQQGEFVLKSEMIEITETEVIVKMPVTMTVRINKDKVNMESLMAGESVVSPAISPAVSRETNALHVQP